MSQPKTFFDKVTRFIFGEPIPVLSENDLRVIHELNQKFDTVVPLFKALPGNNHNLAEQLASSPDSELDALTQQVQKLGKTQFKANTLQEAQLAQKQTLLEELQMARTRQDALLADIQKQQPQAVEAAQMEVLKATLPVLDSLDAAFNTGRRQVLGLQMSKEARQAMVAWLDGLRLARLRLLDLLAAYDVQPISTVGQPFDPHRHIAVAIDNSGHAADGTIISEDRSGYASPTTILREAEVVVARTK